MFGLSAVDVIALASLVIGLVALIATGISSSSKH